MCDTIKKPNETFNRREAHWEIVRGAKTRVTNNMGNRPAELCDTLEEVAEQMSAMVKRTILAMPKNDAQVIIMDCYWS